MRWGKLIMFWTCVSMRLQIPLNLYFRRFNLVRLPFANEVLTSYAKTKDIDISVNPELEDLSPLQVMDKIIAYCGVIGLQVFLI